MSDDTTEIYSPSMIRMKLQNWAWHSAQNMRDKYPLSAIVYRYQWIEEVSSDVES